MKRFIIIPLLFIYCFADAQAVGIGTSTPNSSSVLDLGPSARPMVMPRLSSAEMNAVSNPEQGMFIYNTDEHQLYSYMHYRTTGVDDDRWQPIATGPRMIAWGIVDSFGTVINGSQTFNVTWDAALHWYRLSFISPFQYYRDSMLVMLTALGTGSWDQVTSVGELIEGTNRIAAIKFTDASRLAGGYSTFDARRRSWFHIIIYDLRKEPY